MKKVILLIFIILTLSLNAQNSFQGDETRITTQLPIEFNDIDIKKSKDDIFLLDSMKFFKFLHPIDSFPTLVMYYEYDILGKETRIESLFWDYDINELIPFDIEEMIYNEDNHLISKVYYYWDSILHQWVFEEKDEYTYDVSGNLIQRLDYYWNNQLNSWKEEYKTINEYNETGLLINRLIYSFNDNNEWENFVKENYEYDLSGNLLYYIRSSWESDINDWFPVSKEECVYDSNNKLLTRTDSKWFLDLEQWITIRMYEFDYDINGNTIVYIFSSWNYSLNQLIPNLKDIREYDQNNNLIREIQYDWNIDLQEWVKFSKSERFFNNNGLYLEIVYHWESDNWESCSKNENYYDANKNRILSKYFKWDIALSDWIIDYKRYLYYSTLSFLEEGYNINNILNYPNPFIISTTIEYELNEPSTVQLSVFNQLGQLVYLHAEEQAQGKQQLQWQAEDQPEGLYYFKLQAGNNIATGKLVKVK